MTAGQELYVKRGDRIAEIEEWRDGCIDGWMYGCTDARMLGCMEACMHAWMDG